MSNQTNLTEPEGKAPSSTEVTGALVEQVKTLTSLVDQMRKESAASQQVLADPDVQRIVEMKKAGEDVMVGTKEPAIDPLGELLKPDEPEEVSDESFRNYTPGDLVKHIGDKIGGVIEKAVADQIAPIRDALDKQEVALSDDMAERQNQALREEIVQNAERYPDFKDFRDDMVKLHSGPMTVQDYYLLAKTKKLGLPSEQPQSERPFNFLQTREGMTRTSGEEVRHGRHGFADMLNDSFKKS